MKTPANIETLLQKFEDKYKLPVTQMQQGSEGWLKLKLGVLSASNASKIVAKKTTETRATYMAELVAQVCTGIISEEISSKNIEWGKLNEDAARSCYEFQSGSEFSSTTPVFIFNDETFREGCSPDGICLVEEKGFEIKCPYNSSHFIKFLTENTIKSEYLWQVQFQMRVLGSNKWDVVQYDPRMKKKPLHIVTVERDEEMQSTLNDAVPQFISDMDKMLEKVGVNFGDQWRM